MGRGSQHFSMYLYKGSGHVGGRGILHPVFRRRITSRFDIPGYGGVPRVMISIITMPKDQTSDLVVKLKVSIASGAVHLTGKAPSGDMLYDPSSITRDNPKSATLIVLLPGSKIYTCTPTS